MARSQNIPQCVPKQPGSDRISKNGRCEIARLERNAREELKWRSASDLKADELFLKGRRVEGFRSHTMSGRRAHLREAGWHSRRRPLDPRKVARELSTSPQKVKSLHTRSLR